MSCVRRHRGPPEPGRLRRRWLALSALCALSGAACAGGGFRPERTTWESDLAEGVHQAHGRRAELDDRSAAPAFGRDVAQLSPEDEEVPIEIVAADLEQSMLRFAAEVRMLSQRLAPATGRPTGAWPIEIRDRFARLLDELEIGLAVAPDTVVPRRTLLQARVTTEAELETSERRFGPAPDDVRTRVRMLHGTVAVLMRRSAEALGQKLRPQKAPTGLPALEWPVAPVMYTSFFGPREDPVSGRVRFHTGVDLGAHRGTLVTSAAAGRVIHASYAGGYGLMVVVQHTGGYQTVYAHLSKALVELGGTVDQGSPVGQVGSSGRSTGPHLHFEVRHGGQPIDPIRAVGRPKLRLELGRVVDGRRGGRDG